ncbi:Efflux pump radE [Cladobotryum mycophilum]|uniref:Efflux pump radE n=1 Tax=Cladobotryum mycophilum TaxID=491253 RepID=A0ABR0S9N7_9HYPO
MAAQTVGGNDPETPSRASTIRENPPSDIEKDADRELAIDEKTVEERETIVNEDPNIVDWDGPDDPENPLNWPSRKKFAVVAIVSAITFISPLASSIFAPGIQQVMDDFHSTNPELASFIVSVYVIGYASGPLVLAPLSELYGRSPLYHTCNVFFIIFTVACALSPNMTALIIFRLLAGVAGSCSLTIGAGTLADVISFEKRGKAMAAWVFGPLFGPVVGPIAGGYLTQAKGWRWAFWVVAMTSGVVTVLTFIFLRESYPVTLLERKAKRLRKETGNPNLRSKLDTGRSPKDIFSLAIVRPSKMLLCSPVVFSVSLYMAIVYGYLYLLFTALPGLYTEHYHFSTGSVGLTYIGLGAGSLIGILTSGGTSDRLVQYLRARNGGEAKPEYRLPIMFIASLMVPTALFWFGWTAQTHQHWILPIIGMSFMGAGMTMSFMSTSIYLVDAFGMYAASAIAATTVLRSLGGALLPLAGKKMFEALGYGWGGSLLAFIAVAMIPLPIVFYTYGKPAEWKSSYDLILKPTNRKLLPRPPRPSFAALKRQLKPVSNVLTADLLKMLRTQASSALRKSLVRSAAPVVASRANSTHAISNPTLANIEKRWEGMPLQEQADLWMSLRDRMKGSWTELTLQEKKAAYWIAFGPHGPRTADPPEPMPALPGVSPSASEYQEATNEMLKGQNADPLTGIASEGYTGKGVIQSPPKHG